MIISHLLNLAQSLAHEHNKRKTRSPRWESVERGFKAKHPECVACKSKSFVQVHHKVPVSKDPTLELIESNLISLCMSFKNECHLRIGHGGDFHHYNPFVEHDALRVRFAPDLMKQVQDIAAHSRLPNQPDMPAPEWS